MSRTKKGGKAPGFEYWSKRPCKGGGGCPGKQTKTLTHRAERRQGKDEVKDIKEKQRD